MKAKKRMEGGMDLPEGVVKEAKRGRNFEEELFGLNVALPDL